MIDVIVWVMRVEPPAPDAPDAPDVAELDAPLVEPRLGPPVGPPPAPPDGTLVTVVSDGVEGPGITVVVVVVVVVVSHGGVVVVVLSASGTESATVVGVVVVIDVQSIKDVAELVRSGDAGRVRTRGVVWCVFVAVWRWIGGRVARGGAGLSFDAVQHRQGRGQLDGAVDAFRRRQVAVRRPSRS